MSPNIREVSDSGPEPGYPSVAAMRESQAAGATGNGTQDGSYNDQERVFNQNFAAPHDGAALETPSDDDAVSDGDGQGGMSWLHGKR